MLDLTTGCGFWNFQFLLHGKKFKRKKFRTRRFSEIFSSELFCTKCISVPWFCIEIIFVRLFIFGLHLFCIFLFAKTLKEQEWWMWHVLVWAKDVYILPLTRVNIFIFDPRYGKYFFVLTTSTGKFPLLNVSVTRFRCKLVWLATLIREDLFSSAISDNNKFCQEQPYTPERGDWKSWNFNLFPREFLTGHGFWDLSYGRTSPGVTLTILILI